MQRGSTPPMRADEGARLLDELKRQAVGLFGGILPIGPDSVLQLLALESRLAGTQNDASGSARIIEMLLRLAEGVGNNSGFARVLRGGGHRVRGSRLRRDADRGHPRGGQRLAAHVLPVLQEQAGGARGAVRPVPDGRRGGGAQGARADAHSGGAAQAPRANPRRRHRAGRADGADRHRRGLASGRGARELVRALPVGDGRHRRPGLRSRRRRRRDDRGAREAHRGDGSDPGATPRAALHPRRAAAARRRSSTTSSVHGETARQQLSPASSPCARASWRWRPGCRSARHRAAPGDWRASRSA